MTADEMFLHLAECMRVVQRLRAEQDRIERHHRLLAAQVARWVADETGDLPERLALAEAATAEAAIAYAEATGTKTVSTPWGTAKTRTDKAWQWDDEVALKWALDNAPELVVTPAPQPRIDKQQIKAEATVASDGRVLLLGEPIDGVTCTPRTTTTITTTEEA